MPNFARKTGGHEYRWSQVSVQPELVSGLNIGTSPSGASSQYGEERRKVLGRTMAGIASGLSIQFAVPDAPVQITASPAR